MAGLKSAWAQGVKSGRRRLMAPTDLVKAKELLATSGLKAAEAAAMLKVSERTLFRAAGRPGPRGMAFEATAQARFPRTQGCRSR